MSGYYFNVDYIDLTDNENLEYKQSIVSIDDKIDMMLLKDFIKWYGSKKIDRNDFGDKWEHFMDVYWNWKKEEKNNE